jgi:diguanylate cyclase (GGDEF)-like protein
VKVLVADDDPEIRLLARHVVENLGDECLEASTVEEALEVFTRVQPQMLLLDRQMPPRDGLQVCQAVRRAEVETHGYAYIVMLTSLASREDVLAGIEAGADDYVLKPLDPFLLESRLLVAHRVTRLHKELERSRAELRDQAATDPLTGLHNRLGLSDELDRLHQLSTRHGRHYSLALCDIDHFKQYNDTYGHQAGDRALQALATVLAGFGRREDSVYRYGGEEFLLVLPEQSAEPATAALERLRAAVEGLGIHHRGSPHGVLTISVGVASFVPGSKDLGDELLNSADVALYNAKSAGRNRVRHAALGTRDPG